METKDIVIEDLGELNVIETGNLGSSVKGIKVNMKSDCLFLEDVLKSEMMQM